MVTKEQKKGKARQVRIRENLADRVDNVAIKASADRNERLNAIDIYDEILEKELPKYERKLGIA
jgi:ribosome-associated translation inhibitor RaiA